MAAIVVKCGAWSGGSDRRDQTVRKVLDRCMIAVARPLGGSRPLARSPLRPVSLAATGRLRPGLSFRTKLVAAGCTCTWLPGNPGGEPERGQADENRRTHVARKLLLGNADEDCRTCAAGTPVGSPAPRPFSLLFQQLQEHFKLYRIPPGTDYWTWLAFYSIRFCKAFVNWMDIYTVRFTEIRYASHWGQHLVLFKE